MTPTSPDTPAHIQAVASDASHERLAEPLKKLLGERTAKALAKLGLTTAGELLEHYPRRWAEAGQATEIGALHGMLGEHITVSARVLSASVRTMASRGGAMLSAVVTDGTDNLHLTFFAKNTRVLSGHEYKLRPGRMGLFSGVVGTYRNNLQLTHPDYLFFGDDVEDAASARSGKGSFGSDGGGGAHSGALTQADEGTALAEASRPTPIYPATAAIASWGIAQAVRSVLDTLTEADVPDPLPDDVRAAHGYTSLLASLRDIHTPHTMKDAHRGKARLKFDEAFVLQTELARRRAQSAGLDAVARPPLPAGRPSLLADFEARLPFTLTASQQDVGTQIAHDLAQPHPMQRLLQGDVGSGKTVVALRAMLQVIDAGGQAALLAPTEVLAAQHAQSLRALLGPLAGSEFLGDALAPDHATKVTLLTGSLSAPARKQALADAASGAAGLVVGTHALLGDTVQFAELGLVVVDEQHRFGVAQRDLLRTRAEASPHLLVMTATPIPRTVAMTVFGHLQTSTLTESPAGRVQITTHVVDPAKVNWVTRMWAVAREQIDAGNRVYVVCPRIDPDSDADDDGFDDTDDSSGGALPGPGNAARTSPKPPLRAVLEVINELGATPALAGVPMGILHGRMSASEKEAAMGAFAAGTVPLLVTTTVVEVGVDVPEATVMIILDADRFGISQLHQLRGRVGRSDRASVCFLVSGADPDSDAAARVGETAATTDGFELAQRDLDRRREGDVLGAAQSGASRSLRLLRVVSDSAILDRARVDAEAVIAADPTLEAHPVLAAALARQLRDERAEFINRA